MLFRNHQISPGVNIFMKFCFTTVNIATRTSFGFNLYCFKYDLVKLGHISPFVFTYLPSNIKLNYTIRLRKTHCFSTKAFL